MPVGTRASNSQKHPGLVALSPKAEKAKRRTREEMEFARKEKEADMARKEAHKEARALEKKNAMLKLALTELQQEMTHSKEEATYPRSRIESEKPEGSKREHGQPPKKKKKQDLANDMEVTDGADDRAQSMEVNSMDDGDMTPKPRSKRSRAANGITKEMGALLYQLDNGVSSKVETLESVRPRPVHRRKPENKKNEVAFDKGEMQVDDLLAFKEDPKTPVPNKRNQLGKNVAETGGDTDSPSSLSSSPDGGIGQKRLKRTYAFIQSEDETTEVAPPGMHRPVQSDGGHDSDFFDLSKLAATKQSVSKLDRNSVNDPGAHDLNQPRTTADTGRQKGGEPRCPSVTVSESEHSTLDESEATGSPVPKRLKKVQDDPNEFRKQIDAVKERLKANISRGLTATSLLLTESQHVIQSDDVASDPNLNQAANRNGSRHAKVPQDVPAFEEDQEVEWQAMLSSPIKHGKRITNEALVTITMKETRDKSKKKPAKAKQQKADSADEMGASDDAKGITVKHRGRPSSRRNDSGHQIKKELDHVSEDSAAETLEPIDAKPRQRRKRPTNLSNLPEAIKKDNNLWKVTVLGAYRAYIACSGEVWTINDSTALEYLQAIWNHFANKNQAQEFARRDPVLPLLKQKMNDWRHKFVEHSFLALRTFFEGHKDETIEQRKARVELQLENKNFVYRTLETSNEGMVVRRSGPFFSQLVLQTFAYHLSVVNGKKYDVPGLPPPEKPRVAMALAASAVERALTYWRDGILQPSPEKGFQLSSQYVGSKDYSFSADNWSKSTGYFMNQLKKLENDTARWNKINEAAKAYLKPRARKASNDGSSGATEVDGTQDLEMTWED